MVDTFGKLDRDKSRADEKLFRHLVEAHGLDGDGAELLTALADEHELVRISEIFLRPSLVDASPDAKRWSADDVARLRRRVGFPESPPS